MTSPCHISAYLGFSGSLSQVFFQYINEVLSDEQEKDSIIRVMVGSKNPSLRQKPFCFYFYKLGKTDMALRKGWLFSIGNGAEIRSLEKGRKSSVL